jgi:hypothetical protein
MGQVDINDHSFAGRHALYLLLELLQFRALNWYAFLQIVKGFLHIELAALGFSSFLLQNTD